MAAAAGDRQAAQCLQQLQGEAAAQAMEMRSKLEGMAARGGATFPDRAP